MRKLGAILIVLALVAICLYLLPTEAQAVASGICGDDLTWSLDDEGTLTISGTGDMYNYSSRSAPWYKTGVAFRRIIIEEGVTGVGSYAFGTNYGSVLLTVIPSTLSTIGREAFMCGSRCVIINGESIAQRATTYDSLGYLLYKTSSVLIKEGLSYGSYVTNGRTYCSNGEFNGSKYKVFSKCSSHAYKQSEVCGMELLCCENCDAVINFTEMVADVSAAGDGSVTAKVYKIDSEVVLEITGYGDMISSNFPWYDYLYLISRVEIDYGIKSIPDRAFDYHSNVASIVIPISVSSIGWNAVKYCDNLQTVYYMGTQEEWNQIVIDSGNDLLTNAMVVYDYIGDSYEWDNAGKVATVNNDGARIDISESDKILNLNGKKNVTVEFASNAELAVVDTAFMDKNGNVTDMTGTSAGSLTVKGEGKITPVTLYNGYRYLAVNENGTYSFHPFNLTVSKIGISTCADTVTLRATFIANDVVKGLVKDYGLTNLTEGESATAKGSYGFGDVHGFHAYFDLKGSLDAGSLSDEKDFCAYITIGEQTVSSAQNVHIVPETVLERICEVYDDYSAVVRDKLLNLIKRNIHLTEIPVIAQIMNRAVLATDKAEVDEMNKCLSAFVAGRPEDFGSIKTGLYEHGWSREDDFIPLSEGYSFRWYAEENMVLLVDGNHHVVYPEEYVGLADVDNIRKYFDMSLPAAKVEIEREPESIELVDIPGIPLDLETKYVFEATNESSVKYRNWLATFYVSVELPEGMDKADIALAGSYGDYGWVLCLLSDISEEDSVNLLQHLGFDSLPYDVIQNIVQRFYCGVIDGEKTPAELISAAFPDGYDGPTGAVMTVELRLTNPDNSEEQIVLALAQHEFGAAERTDIADKSLVRFWNTYFIPSLEETPGDFGTFKEELLNFGFFEETLVPKTEGYKFCWYAEENVIVLVDDQNQVIYPNAYKGVDASDVRLFFELSLPVATSNPVPQFTVTKDANPAPVKVKDYSSLGIDEASIVVKYDITAAADYNAYYNDWIIDLYLCCELPEGVSQVDIGLVGAYEENYYWYPAVLRNFYEGKTLALWGDIFSNAPTYAEFQNNIKTLSCAVVDPEVHSEHYEQIFGDDYDDVAGATLNVELRLTNPEDNTDYVTAGVYRYTF